MQSILQAAGLKVATQKYEYTSAGITHQGENTYAIIHAPRGDATEAIVLVAPWLTADDELNLNGVTLALTLARYFKSGWFRGCAPLVWLLTVDARMVIMVQGYHLPNYPGQQNGNSGLDRCLPRYAPGFGTATSFKEWSVARSTGYRIPIRSPVPDAPYCI